MHFEQLFAVIGLALELLPNLRLLPQILANQEKIMTTQAEFDTDLQALKEQSEKIIGLLSQIVPIFTDLQTAYAAVQAKQGQVTTVDFTAEDAIVKGLLEKGAAVVAQAAPIVAGTQPATPAEPTPVPTPEPPATPAP